MYSLIVDLFLAVLLIVTIGYAIVLNKRLGTLRRDKAQLEKLSVSFGDSTIRAEESIVKLMTTADLLQDSMEKAQGLRDDLVFLIDRGGRTADKLEDLVRESRDMVGVGPQSLKGRVQDPAPEPEPAPEQVTGEPGLLKAGPVEESNAGLSAPLSAPLSVPKADEDEFTSEAERELLKAIRSAG